MIEVLVRWTGTSMAQSMVSVLNFTNAPGPEATRDAVQAWLEAMAPRLHENVSWEVETSGRDFDAGTGQTTALWTDPRPLTGAGAVKSGESVANATMVLLQWRTGIYKDGREMRGRTFIPGLNTLSLDDGELGATARGIFLAAAQGLVDSGVGLSVWSRPKDGTPGSSAPVTIAGVWNELAVLRSRRG